MTKRIIVALGIALVCTGPMLAQTPDYSGPFARGPVPTLTLAPAEAELEGGNSFWVSGDYIFAWFQKTNLPALVTTSPSGTPLASAGVLGQPGTSVLFGGPVNNELRSGFRLETGYWFDNEQKFGVETGFMMLESQSTIFAASSDTFPILGRPFINAVTAAPSAILVAFPGAGVGSATGAIDVRASSGNFYEGHFDLTEKALICSWGRLDALFGYRFYRYDDGLRIRQTISPQDPAAFPAGTRIVSADDFGTRNIFHGCDMGLRGHIFWDALSLDLLCKVAIGNVNREVSIAGSQVTSAPGLATVVQQGGLYALISNIGNHASDDWTSLTELGATVNWHVSPNLRLRVGYTGFYLDGIARASDQVSLVVNRKFLPPANPALPGPTRPVFTLSSDNVWINSVSLGMEFSY